MMTERVLSNPALGTLGLIITPVLLSFPVFVFGVYISRASSVVKQNSIQLVILSCLVVSFQAYLLAIRIATYSERYSGPFDDTGILWCSWPTILCALPAGAAFVKMEKNKWLACLAPISGAVCWTIMVTDIWRL
jgi:hypothetical protein